LTSDLVVAGNSGELDYANMSYTDLLAMDSLRVEGFAIVEKADLLGVPHIITRVTYWRPNKGQLGMVSVEATIADEATLKSAVDRGWVPDKETVDALKVKANERIVYNDGSTGIRRQLTSLFVQQGLVQLGKHSEEDRENGRAFDQPWTEWQSFNEWRRQSEEVGNVPSFSRLLDNRPLILRADRGLSVSSYSNEYTDEGETYYLR